MKNLIIKYFALSILVLNSWSFSAQEINGLLVVYNLFDNTITYLQNGHQIDKPEVNSGDNIYVQIEEFNPYINKARLEVTQLNYSQSSMQLNTNDDITSGGFQGVSQLLGGLSMGSDLQGGLFSFGSARGNQSKEAITIKSKYFDLTAELQDVESRINDAQEKVNLIQKQSQAQALAIADIESLKSNKLIRPTRIRDLMEEEIRFAFAKSKEEKITIDDLMNEESGTERVKSALDEYSTAVGAYKLLQKQWKKLSLNPTLLATEDSQLKRMQMSADSVSKIMALKIENQNENDVDDYENSYQDINSLRLLRQTYEEIQNDIFTYKFPPLQAKEDQVVINLIVSQLDEDGSYTTFKTVEQIIPITGDWKISGGVGLAFSKMIEQPYSYDVVDGLITSEPLDDFIPMFSSFVHAYRLTSKTVSYGLSFGVGFPLQSLDDSFSLSYFLGPTLIIGKSEKVLLTGGLMGSKVSRLSGGYMVGDSYPVLASTLPQRNRYELGYFLSFSYAVLKN